MQLYPDPKDLIDIPGAGRAEVALRATGAWDEGRAPGAVGWAVTVYASVTVEQVVKVRAVSEEEAKRLAICKAKADGGWSRGISDPVVEHVYAEEVRDE